MTIKLSSIYIFFGFGYKLPKCSVQICFSSENAGLKAQDLTKQHKDDTHALD